ncbi:hypothetical protein CAPTEDRAFT_89939 [Capitella teleta]|uniref:BTB domain-containing protein n=1 Tax=Capitella teleta TaxID=283909 RepID=R7TBH9_CAPTE|nr:hypothetical protein CAPTEDRAFT_89939 [Capitella teleta]|eukprot:ELT90817.1 hypothetical protein CAPTEDRAFT_89939 [Capitella teleta]
MSLNFRNMRHADEMVDVVLVFGETRVKCHRLVLAAACEYFRLMFQTDMQEKAASEIAMKEVSSNTGLQLVEYLYSGNIEISTENAQELLAASDRLLLVDLKKMVGVFLCGQADTNNCVSLLNLARLYRLESLGGISQQFLTDHWKELIETEEIYQLAEDDLHLMVIGGMKSANFYLDLVECLDLETLEWSEFPHLPKALLLPSVVYVQKQLFVVGGEPSSTTTSGDVYEFDSAERAWQPRCPMPQVYKGADAVSVDNKILVLGGVYRVCMQYDPCGDLWIQLQRSQFQHITGRAVVWKDKIVVCGGRDTDSIEEYDPCLDKWSTWNLKMPFEDMCFALIIKGNV